MMGGENESLSGSRSRFVNFDWWNARRFRLSGFNRFSYAPAIDISGRISIYNIRTILLIYSGRGVRLSACELVYIIHIVHIFAFYRRHRGRFSIDDYYRYIIMDHHVLMFDLRSAQKNR